MGEEERSSLLSLPAMRREPAPSQEEGKLFGYLKGSIIQASSDLVIDQALCREICLELTCPPARCDAGILRGLFAVGRRVIVHLLDVSRAVVAFVVRGRVIACEMSRRTFLYSSVELGLFLTN